MIAGAHPKMPQPRSWVTTRGDRSCARASVEQDHLASLSANALIRSQVGMFPCEVGLESTLLRSRCCFCVAIDFRCLLPPVTAGGLPLDYRAISEQLAQIGAGVVGGMLSNLLLHGCAESGARVSTNVLCATWTSFPTRHATFGVGHLPLHHGTQLAIDTTTMVSPLRRNGATRPRNTTVEGPRGRDRRSRLVVLARSWRPVSEETTTQPLLFIG